MMRHVAVVHAVDGVRYAVTAPSRSALYRELGDYVMENAEHRLWPRDLTDVVDRVREGNLEEAVEQYFARVGSRWDEEWIVINKVGTAGHGAGDTTCNGAGDTTCDGAGDTTCDTACHGAGDTTRGGG